MQQFLRGEKEMRDTDYKELEILDNGGFTALVRELRTGKLYVRKYVNISLRDVYLELKKINNDHIPQIHKVIEETNLSGKNVCVIFEEFVSGITFEQLRNQKKMLESEVLDYIIQLCQALSCIHQMGIIHRDIKPSNIILNSDGIVKLIDFGIARVLKPRVKEDTLLLGTRGYAAPEQYGFGQSEEYTDIYAVGVLMNVLLVGQLPADQRYQGSSKGIIEKCIHINPRERFQNVEELSGHLIVLRERLNGKYKVSRHRIIFVLVSILVLSIAILVGIIKNGGSKEDKNIIYVTNDNHKNKAKYLFSKEQFPFQIRFSDEFEVIGETKTNNSYSVNIMNRDLFLSVWVSAFKMYKGYGYETGEDIYSSLRKAAGRSSMVYYEDIKTKGAAISYSSVDDLSVYYGGSFIQIIRHEILFTRDGYLIYITAEVPSILRREYNMVINNLRAALDENEKYEDKGRATLSEAERESIENGPFWIEESTSDPSARFGRIMETVDMDEYTEDTSYKVYEEIDLSE